VHWRHADDHMQTRSSARTERTNPASSAAATGLRAREALRQPDDRTLWRWRPHAHDAPVTRDDNLLRGEQDTDSGKAAGSAVTITTDRHDWN